MRGSLGRRRLPSVVQRAPLWQKRLKWGCNREDSQFLAHLFSRKRYGVSYLRLLIYFLGKDAGCRISGYGVALTSTSFSGTVNQNVICFTAPGGFTRGWEYLLNC